MSILIYNSLTRKKEEFRPLHPPYINIYTCGVTVYDECHIGHARSLYVFDVMRRYLEYRKFKVNFVRNITDIDDKIINRAKELNTNWKELVKKYIDSYNKDLELLEIGKGILDKEGEEPRATKNIPEMIKFIEGLINKDYAYVTDSGVYFSVRKFKDYGKLSGQSIDQMLSGARIEPEEHKQDPLDFALWKSSKPDEPSWDSPWGKGRPGWHIECSVMSQKFLNTATLDIHAGGRDLIFPHHENEIAQSETKTGKPFAKYWIHHGLLTINGQKMAKSLGNFVTVKDFVKKYKDTDILKLLFLSAHYSSPIDYNEEKIEECKKQKKSFNSFFDKVNNWVKVNSTSSDKDKKQIDDICEQFHRAMDDDFNISLAFASLFELIDSASSFFSRDKEAVFNYAKSKLESFFKIFGLKVKQKKKLPQGLMDMSLQRQKERERKNYKKADDLRDKMATEYHYIPSDTNLSTTLIEIEE